ncbi:hypothetical protein HaLaN_20132, partial [Haematococcus lacustris]
MARRLLCRVSKLCSQDTTVDQVDLRPARLMKCSMSLSSLSNAPSLGGRANPAATAVGSSDATTRSVVRDPSLRRSTPAASSRPAADEDDDLPRARGLVKKEMAKAASSKDVPSRKPALNTSDSDDDPPLPRTRATAAGSGAGRGAGSTGSGMQPTGRSATPSAGLAGSNPSNPILALMDDDDDLLAGLAPPKKDSTPATASGAGLATSRGSAGSLGLSSAPVGKSLDVLASFMKADDDILKKPLPFDVADDTLDIFGSSGTSRLASAQPRRGRRAGGDEEPQRSSTPTLPSATTQQQPVPSSLNLTTG